MSLAVLADHMASKGRGPDSMLIHMSPREVQGLQALAMKHGGSLTINPETGLPEAGILDKLLPAIIGFALAPMTAGTSLAFLGATPMASALTVGALQTLRTGDIGKGIQAGLGAYGGAGLQAGLATAGAGAIGSEAARAGAGITADMAYNLADAGITDAGIQSLGNVEAANQALQQQAAERVAAASPFDKLSAGAKSVAENPMNFANKDNLKYLAAAAGPAIMAGANVQAKGPQTVTKPGMIRPYSFDPYGGTYTAGTPYEAAPTKAAEGGLMGMNDGGYNPGQLDFTQRSEPVVRMAIGGDTKKALEDAYAAQDYDTVNSLVAQNKITDADVRGTWGMDTSGLAGLGVNLYQPPAAVDANQLDYFGNPKNTQVPVYENTYSGTPAPNPWIDAPRPPDPVDTEIFDYFARNQNLVKNKDYDTIASDMYVSGWTPEMAARAIGANVTDFTREYDKTYGAFDRATQEDLVNQKYKQQLGLTDAQLGQRYFGAPMDTRENRLTSVPFSNAYEKYQEELALTGRRDAPAGTQFRAKAVYEPGAFDGRGVIKLYDTVTGEHLTNAGYGAYGTLDKFAVDPASYRTAVTQMYEASGKPAYMKDDYTKSLGYKPRDVAAATDTFIRTPLEKATVADLRYDPKRDASGKFSQDTRTNIDWLGSTQRLLMSKGLGVEEASSYLHQFIPVAGLVDWAAIQKSKDPVKAMMGTLNYLQSKGVTNLDPNTGPFSKIGQTRFDASGKKLPARYTGAESLRSLGLRGFASGGITSLAIGGDVKGALENAYATAQQTGDYSKVNDIVSQNKITDADVRGTWGMDTSGLAGLGVNLYNPTAEKLYQETGSWEAAAKARDDAANAANAATWNQQNTDKWNAENQAKWAAQPIQYTDQQIGAYLTANPNVDINQAIKDTRADPNAVNRYIASLSSPFKASTDTKGGSGTLGIYNQMVAQGIDPNEAYAALIANDPKYGGWTKEMIQKGYDLDKGAYALTAQIEKDKIAADPKLGYDKQWVKFMDDNKYSIDDAAQAFGLSRNEVTRRYNAVKDAEKKVITPITKIPPITNVTGTRTGVNTGVIPDGYYGNDTGNSLTRTPGDITTNPDGTVTIQPNIPGRPDGGFPGMASVRDAYTAGGGSLGYIPYAPKTIEEFESKYNTLTGGSKQSYDYLMGKTPYNPTPFTKTGEIMKPYFESVGRFPENRKAKKYVYVDGKYQLNPDYVKPSYVLAGEKAAADKATEEKTTKAGVDSGKSINVLDNQGNTEPAYLRNDGFYYTSGGTKFDEKGVQVAADGGLAALTMAGGGMSGQFDLGGYSDGGRLLRGPGDGVSDSIPATIGNKRPARLADGEFVVPARIVSELGNGSTEAGARKLYAMMDRVQAARKGSIGKGKVAKNSRADKYLPA